MSTVTREEVAKKWVAGLSGDLEKFAERGPRALIADDCMVWHSTDNKWQTAKESLEAVRGSDDAYNLTFGEFTTTTTENGFICQTSMVTPTTTFHVVQVVTVTGGQVSKAMEYIAQEMQLDFANMPGT